MITKDSKTFRWQILGISLLAFIPLTMIYVNGKKAWEGLLWKKSDSPQSVIVESKPHQTLQFGFFDPSQTWQKENPWELELLYISWLYFDKESLRNQLESIIAKQINPILTIEPWASDGDPNVLKSIVEGKYDEVIDQLSYSIKGLKDTVYISWGHEMDQTLTERYSWSGKDSSEFVDAFIYFHDKFPKESHLIKWIWAPVVNKTSISYWLGDGYIDCVAMPVYSFPSWDVTQYGYVRDFEETFDEKYKLLEGYGKPIFIKEFGVSGPEKFKKKWLDHAFLQFKNYPKLRAVIFFNSQDTPGVWGKDVSTPDWRISEVLARQFVRDYQEGKFD